VLLFSKHFIFGRVIASIGLVIFLIAAVQLVKGYLKHEGLVKTGLYSVVRHPQYMGITVMTLGSTIMVLALGSAPQPILMWLIQILGYVALAYYEERHLKRNYGADFLDYERHVPFMLPAKYPHRIPEWALTILLATIASLILFLVPFNLLRFS
jgi:protein-S-isoprenylcysteine O-methyltransferase Ste14